MNQDQIIAWAKQANILEPLDLLESNQWRQDKIREITRFAAIVVKHAAQQPLTKAQIKVLIVATPEPDDGDVGKWVLSLIRAVEKAHKIGSRP